MRLSLYKKFYLSFIVITFLYSKLINVYANIATISNTSITTVNSSTLTATISEPIDIYPKIDITSVENQQERNTLLRIDALNHSLGEDIFVTQEDFYKFRNAKITLIGDSISDCSKSSILKYFKNINMDSLPGREITKAYEIYNNMYRRNILKDSEVIVISLGTNATDGIPIDMLERIYNQLDGKPLVMLTVIMPYNGQERNRNRDIKKFINSHPNCYIADWNKVAKNHPEFFVEDRIHPNGAGGEVYAQLLYKTVARILKQK